MVEYSKLVGLRGPGTTQSRGFTIDISPSWEAEKADREKTTGTIRNGGTVVWEPGDPRWLTPKPWGFFPMRLKFGGLCIYCAERIPVGAFELYSRKLSAVAHQACRAGVD